MGRLISRASSDRESVCALYSTFYGGEYAILGVVLYLEVSFSDLSSHLYSSPKGYGQKTHFLFCTAKGTASL